MVKILVVIFVVIMIQGCASGPSKAIVLQTADAASEDTVTVVCHREKKTGSHLSAVVCRDVDGLAAEGELTRQALQRAQLRTPSSRQM
ncbi:hypothetical protein [Rheinheimera nanhaiensis]|uniref:hypothetical protein n=1 Tax=Rheinheimera nanhaiensis TaxID=1163621 RepID=UPI0011D1CF1D|nr:hypothetical protein [Rheinheimera nanhaiensis]